MIIGLLIGGYLSDRFGRRFILYTGFVCLVVPNWVMVFPKEFIVFIVCRIIIGFGQGIYIYIYIYKLSVLRSKGRDKNRN